MELTRTHYLILYCALDGYELSVPLLGLDEMIGSGERFTLVPPIPPDDARRATLELLEAGAISLSRFDSATGEYRDFELADARAVLADPATWDLEAEPPVAYTHEIGLTDAGWPLYDEAHRLFGDAMERSLDEARARNADFMRRHPDFVEKNWRYLKAMERWVQRGGPEPEPPRFD